MGQTTFKSVMMTGGALILALIGVGYFVTSPQWGKYSEAKAELALAQANNQTTNQALSSLQAFLDDYQKQDENIVKASSALPLKSADLANFVGSVGDLAKVSGVVLSNFSVDELTSKDKTPPENSLQAVAINLSASGSYPSFKDFVLRLENHLRIIDVSHITLKQDDSGHIQYQVTLKTYYQR